MIHLDPCQPADEVAKLLSINFYVPHSHPVLPPAQPFAREGFTASLSWPALSGWAGGPAPLLSPGCCHTQQRNRLMPKARFKNPPQPKNNPSLSSHSPKGSSFLPQHAPKIHAQKCWVGVNAWAELHRKTFPPNSILGRFRD